MKIESWHSMTGMLYQHVHSTTIFLGKVFDCPIRHENVKQDSNLVSIFFFF